MLLGFSPRTTAKRRLSMEVRCWLLEQDAMEAYHGIVQQEDHEWDMFELVHLEDWIRIQTSAHEAEKFVVLQTEWEAQTVPAETEVPLTPAAAALLAHGPATVWGVVCWSLTKGGRCARAVRKVGYCGPISPDGHVTAMSTVFPDAGLLRFLLT